MFDTVIEMLSYPFMTRAFLVGSLVALCSALLGVSLVLKRYSMIGDGLSHVGFGAMAIAAHHEQLGHDKADESAGGEGEEPGEHHVFDDAEVDG